MFRGAKWIVCPIKPTNREALRSVEQLIKAMGATPARMNPDQHDRQIAMLSHLPHAIAGVLVQMKVEFDGDDVSGGSWRDLTRVGGVDPNLWTQIFAENRVELSRAIADMEQRLSNLRTTLDTNDIKAIRTFFEDSRKAKKKAK
jgi:prephenate dehydrogenase